MPPRLRSYQTMKERGITPPTDVPKPIRKHRSIQIDDSPLNPYPILLCDRCNEARPHQFVRRDRDNNDRLIFECMLCKTERGYGF